MNSKPSLIPLMSTFQIFHHTNIKIKTKHQFLAQPMTPIMAGITAGRGDTTLPLLSAGRPGDAGGRAVDGSDFFPSNRRSIPSIPAKPFIFEHLKRCTQIFHTNPPGLSKTRSFFPGTYVKEMKSSIKSHRKFQVPSAPVLPQRISQANHGPQNFMKMMW